MDHPLALGDRDRLDRARVRCGGDRLANLGARRLLVHAAAVGALGAGPARGRGAREGGGRLGVRGALGPAGIADITCDHRIEHQFAWDNRWLGAELKDLHEARDALKREIATAKLHANPLFVPLDDDKPDTKAAADLE